MFLFLNVVSYYELMNFICLLQYLCDRIEPHISCELVRGYLDFSPHAWNVIVVKRGESWVRMIVDACRPLDIREEIDPEYFCRSMIFQYFLHDLFPGATRIYMTTSVLGSCIGDVDSMVIGYFGVKIAIFLSSFCYQSSSRPRF